MIKTVVKRNGQKEVFDISKIKQSIAFACQGVKVNPLELESRIDYFAKNNIKTSEIQENIIQHALQLATPFSPEWLQVAGNAYAMDELHSFKNSKQSFYDVIKNNTKAKVYTPAILDFYTKYEVDELESYMDHSRDLQHSYASLLTARKKYLAKNELNQHMHMINAMRFGQFEPSETRISFVKETYDVLSNREFSLATPFMLNLRSGGNTASCFILAIEDDLNSIFENVHRIAKISKNGGGVGIFLGYLRAKGSEVNGMENAAGTVVQWVKIINDTLVAVNQGGRRAGAGTVALPIWHNDILDFLDMQTEHGDQRMKAYDVFPQVVIPDVFMKREKSCMSWITFCPFEVKNVLGLDVRGKYGQEFEALYFQIEKAFKEGKLKVAREIPNSRDLLKQIMRVQFETGLPYLTFSDTINEVNPNKLDGESYGIPCTNLCVESYSNVKPDVYSHVCNLGSINLGSIRDFDHLAKVSKLACRILNRGVQLTKNPDETTEAHNKRYRTIGIGVMGLHDYLAREFKSYTDSKLISKLFECIQFNAASESVDLAKELGTFEAFGLSEWENGNMTKRYTRQGCGEYDWKWLQTQIDKYGIHNSQLTSPAPTTTTSIYQDASASLLPIYSAFFSENNKNGAIKVSARYLADNPVGYGKTQAKFDAKEIIDLVATAQRWVDTGISMELLFDQNKPSFNAKELYDAIVYAWEQKIKAVYYIRTIKERQEEEVCPSCSG